MIGSHDSRMCVAMTLGQYNLLLIPDVSGIKLPMNKAALYLTPFPHKQTYLIIFVRQILCTEAKTAFVHNFLIIFVSQIHCTEPNSLLI